MRTSLFSWFFICSILLIRADTNSVFGQCLVSQQSLLLQLKNSLDFDPYWSTKIVTWNQSTECCSWEGVSCDEDFNVARLDLSNDGISGNLDNASSLFSLKHLKSLDLSFNFYGFTIQNFTLIARNFPELEELYLDGLNLSTCGNEWCQELSSSLPNLRVLSLSNCHLSGPLDQSLSKLESLSVIHLEANNLSSPVPRSIAKLLNLTSLNLRSTALQGTFPREIFQVPTLQTLDISENEFLRGTLPEFPVKNSLFYVDLSNTKFSGKLPKSIGNLWNLSTLFLSNCQFTGTLPNSMAKVLTRLVHVDLSSNNFTGSVPSFRLSRNLTRLYLSNNSLTGEISSTHWESFTNLESFYASNNFLTGTIPLSLFSLQSLQTIQLSNNQFYGCVSEFNTATSSTLNVLDLSHNNLEGPFPISFFKLEKLTFLDLSYNKFNGTLELNLFQRLTRLVQLDLSYNNWSVHTNGSDYSVWNIRELGLASCNLETLPDLKTSSALQILDLSNNRISGEIPKWIWEIGDMKLAYLNMSRNFLTGFEEPFNFSISLNVLDLHFNKLHGKIPTLLQDIKYVDFSGNRFTSIPLEILQGLHFLGFLSLSNNSLSGFIPELVCNTSSLRVLDFSNNNLSGNIPTCIIGIGYSLDVLNLRNNNFNGIIPDAFPSGCRLKTLDLNGNSLNGNIPKSLANCNNLDVLDLGNNQISGTLPCYLTNISTLQVLILRSNKFHGHIECPESKANWPMLQIIDLAHNELGGEISGQWLTKLQGIMAPTEADATLKVLGFSHHYYISYSKSGTDKEMYYRYTVTVTLKGQEMELPKILTIFTCIDLSSNNFHGSIPDELGQLQALYILNLSNNAFIGQIPLSIGSLRKLESLDLSWNKLNGTISESLGQLNFLQFLNLSFNQLVGRIPKGTQIQTFSEDSFIGNEGLCGPPLSKNCSNEEWKDHATKDHERSNGGKIDWNILSGEIGFIVGFGIVVAPLVFLKSWRNCYFERVDDIIVSIFPSTVARKWFRWTTG